MAAGRDYAPTGHKWFCSAPMSDAFLTLAQTERGLSCFLVPRWRPDGSRNVFRRRRPAATLCNTGPTAYFLKGSITRRPSPFNGQAPS